MENAKHFIEKLPVIGKYFGSVYEQKLYFVPDAQNEPGDDDKHEVSEAALFRFLLNEKTLEEFNEAGAEIPDMLNVLNDIDKDSEITEFEAHQSSMGWLEDFKGAFHVFIVFKTTKKRSSETADDAGVYWWSLEKGMDYITLQRSRNKDDVKDKCYGDPRNNVKSIVENLKGKGTIQDLFALLWAHQVIPDKYNILNSNCQSLVTFVSKQITEKGYEVKGYFPYSAPRESDRDTQMLDLINILRGRSASLPPLFTLILMENIDLFDKIVANGKYDINALHDGLTPLHFAIMYSKTKMVEHLLKPEMNADPITRTSGNAHQVKVDIKALEIAAVNTMKAEIFDLLLAHDKFDVDELGRTALNWAVRVSNVIAVQKLLDKGANPSIFDRSGVSLLDVAAQERDGCPVIDLLLEAKKVKGMGDVNDQNEQGLTALFWAASSSNEITAEHLIEKGADVNHRDNAGRTSLHVAVRFAKNMQIIDLLLLKIKDEDMNQYRNDKKLFLDANINSHGLKEEIIDRLLKKGIIKPRSTETDEVTEESDEATAGVNTSRLKKEANSLMNILRINTLQFMAGFMNSQEMDEILKDKNFFINGSVQKGETPLFSAIRAENVNWVRLLLEKGADPSIRDNDGNTPFHLAACIDRDCNILDLLLKSGKVDINETTSQHGVTALHMAIATSNAPAVRFLLWNDYEANPNVAGENGVTPLHWAALLAKDMDIVELLVNHKDVDVNCLDNKGRNALHYAMINENGHGESIANLLKKKGALDTENDEKNHIEILKRDLRSNSNRKPDEIENFLSDDTKTMEDKIDRISESKEYLVSAIHNSNVESVRLLLKNGADTRTWGESGVIALHLASFHAKTTDVIDVVLETGKFDINGVANQGYTPLHWAVAGTLVGRNSEINVSHLIGKGADPNIADKEGNTPLHLTAVASHAKKITEINGFIWENKQVDKDAETALHSAIMAKNVEIARCLMENGADPTMRNQHGNTPFHMAAKLLPDTDVLSLMLGNNKKINIDESDKKGSTALHLAITASNLTAARFLLANGANPNVVDEIGRTPLHWAALHANDMQIVELLVNRKDTNVDYLDNKGNNALHYAMDNENGLGKEISNLLREKMAAKADGMIREPETIAALVRDAGIEKYADPTIIDNKGIYPLHLAARLATTTDIISRILKHYKVDINGLDSEGNTPLYYAIGDSNVIAVRFLLQKGADPTSIRYTCDINAFHLAAMYSKNSDILDLLLAYEKKKIDIDERNKFGMTALYLAMAYSNVTAVRLLLSKGANPNLADGDGCTPLHMAVWFAKGMDIVKLLVNHKRTNFNCLDNKGRNALDCAMANKHGLGEEIAHLLTEKMVAKAAEINRKPENIAALVDSFMKTIRLLIENGQDISAMTWGENGANALHLAAADEETTNLIDVILETGKFDINGVDSDGRTPLHYAIKRPKPITINARRLIKMGADPGIADKNGVTPLHMAARNENAESMDLIDLLLNTEAVDVNCVDKQGRTPLACARDNKHGLGERIIDRLKKKAVRVEEEICRDNLLDECTSGGEATGNSLDNDESENESETENPKKTPMFEMVVESNGEKIRIQIKEGTILGEGNWGEHVMNALRSASRNAKATELIDISMDTESRDLYAGPSAPKCTSDDDNEKMVKKVLEEAIKHSDAEKVRDLIEMGADLGKALWGKGANALHVASRHAKKTKILDVILETGQFDINGRDEDGETALFFALRAKNMTTARYLLEKGADPTIGDNDGGVTPFHAAAAFIKEPDILGLFLANNKKQLDIDHRNQSGMTALHMAIKVSNRATAEFLLSNGADPNAADQNGNTPLHVAAMLAKYMDIVELLLNHRDTNVDYLDNKGNNALHYAMDNNHGHGEAIANLLREKGATKAEEINQEPENIAALVPSGSIKEDLDMKRIRFLIESGMDISAITWGEKEANLLHLASLHAKTTDIDVILETGEFDINGVDNDGNTPLHYAIMGSNCTKNVPHLIQLGADPNIASKNGITPLHLAAKNEETTELIDVILETEKCNINGVDSDGRTPLHYAIKRPKPITINARRLIKMGADPGIADKNGVTPLHMAAKNENAESMDLIEILLNTEAVDVNCVDYQGLTPLACARANKHGLSQRIFDRLRKSGANEW